MEQFCSLPNNVDNTSWRHYNSVTRSISQQVWDSAFCFLPSNFLTCLTLSLTSANLVGFQSLLPVCQQPCKHSGNETKWPFTKNPKGQCICTNKWTNYHIWLLGRVGCIKCSHNTFLCYYQFLWRYLLLVLSSFVYSGLYGYWLLSRCQTMDTWHQTIKYPFVLFGTIVDWGCLACMRILTPRIPFTPSAVQQCNLTATMYNPSM